MDKKTDRPIYAYPKLSRTDLWWFRAGGDGLGNLLFNWARCLSHCRQDGYQMIWPAWASIKPKNLRVNPHDFRFYGNLFSRPAGVVGGWEKARILATSHWVPEAKRQWARPGDLVIYRGMGGYFQPFRWDHALISRALAAMTRPSHKLGLGQRFPVGIHIRRGDFLRGRTESEIRRRDGIAIPIEWYTAALEALRGKIGEREARVFSDGTDRELQPILDMPHVTRCDYGSAIGDLLALSGARYLIASGSTFSMWASYLGQMPTVWYPSKLIMKLNLAHPEWEFEWEPGLAMPDSLPAYPNEPSEAGINRRVAAAHL